MRQIFKQTLSLAIALIAVCNSASAVDVTLTFDEFTTRPASVGVAEKNLAAILTEINRAQKAGEYIQTASLKMDDFSKKSLARLWTVTPFYCDDEEVVERCWVFKDGTMMVSHIPLIITPQGEDFGMGAYQEAVVEFDAKGTITDFRFALDAHTAESMERCGSVVEKEKQMIILKEVERFRTAYNMKDIETIERMFSDDALIITGKVIKTRQADSQNMGFKVEYNRQTKEQYIANLKKAFIRNKWIEVKFTQIGDNNQGGCAGITRSNKNPNMYGVRLHQAWRSSNYSDDGYLFLLWEFPEDGSDPIIHVRTWQPEFLDKEKTIRQAPDPDISTLGGFDL